MTGAGSRHPNSGGPTQALQKRGARSSQKGGIGAANKQQMRPPSIGANHMAQYGLAARTRYQKSKFRNPQASGLAQCKRNGITPEPKLTPRSVWVRGRTHLVGCIVLWPEQTTQCGTIHMKPPGGGGGGWCLGHLLVKSQTVTDLHHKVVSRRRVWAARTPEGRGAGGLRSPFPWATNVIRVHLPQPSIRDWKGAGQPLLPARACRLR